MPILAHIQSHWVEWLFAVISAILIALYRNVCKRLKEQQLKDNAIAEGMQSLLRESIVSNYNKYQEKGFCPIYAKESIKRVYKAYHNLGGNDVATHLYEKIIEMQEEPTERRSGNEL